MMNNAVYLKAGRWLFAIAMLAIGVIHLVTRNFPTGLSPVPATLPFKIWFLYINGIVLIVSGLMMLTKKFTYCGALLAGIVWLILLLGVHLPLLLPHLHDGGEWTVTFETISLFSGALLLVGNSKPGHGNAFLLTGKYLFLASLIVYTVLHYVYFQFITTLIPGWLPGHTFWCAVVLVAFFAASVSLLINVQVRLAMLLLSFMFLLWVVILHLPRVIGNCKIETEWTSMFIALAMGGVALLLAGATESKK
jgi:uncharacterized membrane protein